MALPTFGVPTPIAPGETPVMAWDGTKFAPATALSLVSIVLSGALSLASLTISGQLTSTLATGTAPFVVASQTLVSNLYGARAALADSVTTNANLTGPITSVGNATALAAQTGTGSVFVVQNTPTLTTPVIGAATGTSLVLSGSLTSNALTSGRVTSAGTSGILQDFAGHALIGTPSATAPSTGTSGPGTFGGIVHMAANATASAMTNVSFGGGAAQTCGHRTFVCQGTAASPGATIVDDQATFSLHGHDGTNFTGSMAAVQLFAGGTWTPTSRESYIQFGTTASGAAAPIQRGRVASGGQLVWVGGSFGASSLFTGSTITPAVQIIGNNSVDGGTQSITTWRNIGSAAPVFILAKSRSATVGTPGVITTGDTLGTIAAEGDDGTDFARSSAIIFMTEGTIAANQIPGIIRFQTASSAGTLTTWGQIDSNQCLVVGGNFSSSGTFSAGTLRPHIQTASTNTSQAAIAQTSWQSNATGPTGILAKSRSAAPGTQGVVTTADTIGTISWQGDDGTNFIEGARIKVTCTGTIGTGQMSMRFAFDTMNAAATVKTALTLTELQSVVVGNAALATNATDGFFYFPSCAGTPTGVPTANTGRVALVYDSTNNIIYIYNGAWKKTVALT